MHNHQSNPFTHFLPTLPPFLFRNMSEKPSRRVTFSPDITNRPQLPKPDANRKTAGNRRRITGSCTFRLPRRTGFLPVKFLRRLGASMMRAIRVVSVRRVSPKAVPSSRSGPVVAQQVSHRTEAIEDCIEFINSSSSLPRSNSTKAV